MYESQHGAVNAYILQLFGRLLSAIGIILSSVRLSVTLCIVALGVGVGG